MSGLLKGDLDVAQAMIYNEYAQVLEAKNPATGALYAPADLNLVDFNDPAVGTAMLQDQIFASDEWLKTGNNDRRRHEVPASELQGLDLLPRQPPEVRRHRALEGGSQLGASHQAWQMNEINALIWPSPNGIGLLDKTLYDQTIQIATTYGVLKARSVRRRYPHGPGPEGARRAGLVGRHQGRDLPEGDGHAQGGRQLGRSRLVNATEGRSARAGPLDSAAGVARSANGGRGGGFDLRTCGPRLTLGLRPDIGPRSDPASSQARSIDRLRPSLSR